MFMVRFAIIMSLISAIPASTSVERFDLAQSSLTPQSLQPAYAAYAPNCTGQCGWAALPFTR